MRISDWSSDVCSSDLTYDFDYLNLRVISDNVPTLGTYTSTVLHVPRSTAAMTVCFQDSRANSALTLFPPSKFAIDTTDEQNKITRFQMQYSSQMYPPIPFSLNYDVAADAGINQLTALYKENHYQLGSAMSMGGGESFKDWLNSGIFLHFDTPKAANDQSSQVTVNYQMATTYNNANGRLLLFAHKKDIARIRWEQGQIVEVLVEEI